MIRTAEFAGRTGAGRKSHFVAQSLHRAAEIRKAVADRDARFDLLDEVAPAIAGKYQNAPTGRWPWAVAYFGGVVPVAPEYSPSAQTALKNAVDCLWRKGQSRRQGSSAVTALVA